MVVNFHAAPPILTTRLLADTRQKESVKATSDGAMQSADVDNPDDSTPAALQQKLVDMADDMASVATQFRNRRDLQKKGAASDENFERVLDEDAENKAQKLSEVASVQDRSLDGLLAQARSLFPDDSDLFLVLKELLKRKQLSQIQRKTLEALLQTVTAKADPKALKGGINCALKARLFGASLGLKASFLRQTYRRFLESDSRPLDEYEDWITTYGFKSRHIVTNFIEESLGTDIRAEDPSCSFMEFGNLLMHMRKLHLVRTSDLEFVNGLMKKSIGPQNKARHSNPDQEEAAWLLLFMSLVRDDVAPATLLHETMQEWDLACHTARSVWLNAVRCAYKQLPSELLINDAVDADDQPQLDAAMVLSAIDTLIEENYVAEQREQRRSAT